MAQEFTPEELGLPSTPQEFTPEELGLSPTVSTKKEFTPEELGITPTISAETKPEDAGFLARTKQALTEGFESFGGVKRGLELGSVATDQDMAAAAAKMQEIKTKGEVPPAVQTLSASDIQRIAEEKGIIPAGMKIPSYVVEQILKSGPEMAVPLLTGYAATVLSAPTGIAAPFIGAAVGIGTYGVQQYGHFMERQALEKNAPQELDPASAKKWAAITAPLGYIVDRFTLGLGKGGAKAGQAVVKELAERKGAAIAKGAGVGAVKGLSEVPTEVLEQAAERYQAGLPLSGDEANKEYFEAGWGALAVGSGLGGAAGAYGKYKKVKAVTNEIKETNKAKEKVLSDDLEDVVAKQPNRDDVKAGLFEQIKDQAETIKTKRIQAKAKPIAEPVEDEIEPSSILDEATLTSLGFRKSTNAFKSLIGKDISLEETRALLDQVAENNPTKVNEEAFTNYKASLPPVVELTKQPTKEPADAKPIQLETGSEADRASVRALDESQRVRETAAGIEGREPTGVDTTRGDAGQLIAGTERERAPLAPKSTEVLKGEAALAKPIQPEGKERIMSVMELLNQPDLNLRYEARRKYVEDLKTQEAVKYSKYVAKLKELAKKVSPTLPIVKQSNNLANVLTALKDPPRYLIEDLKNPNVIDTERRELNQQARDYITLSNLYDEFKVKMSPQERKALEQEGKKISKEEGTLSEEEVKDLQDEFLAGREEELPSKLEGTPEGKAIVNTTKPAKTLGQALTILKNQHFDKLNPVQKVLHRVISKLPNVTKGTYKVMGMEKGEFGSYAPLQNKTTISPDAGVDTIFHEATHSATTLELKKHVTMKNGRPVARTPQGQKMVDIFDAAEVAAMQQELDFGETFLNMDEFIANAYNNEAFQRFLAGERSVVPDAPPTSTLWTDFVNSVKQLLNLGDISNTLLSDVLSVTPDLFTGTRQVGTATIPDFSPQEKLYSREKVDRLDKLLKDTNIKTEKAEETKAFQEFKDDPAQFVKNKQKGFQRFLDKAETNFFSSDAALSNAIRRGLEENGEWDETKKVMYSISTSQALHAEAPAHQFLEDGNIAYDETLHKYVVSKAKDSWKTMMQTVKQLADKYGVPYEKMEQYAHVAMIAQRLKGLKDFNRELKEDVVDLLVEGKDKEAKKMWDKNYKHIHMTTKEINAGVKLFDEIPELSKVVDQWNGIRENVLKFGIDSGLYSKDQVEALLDVMDYVPFYRVAQLEQNQGPKEYTRGLLDRALTDPKFKGSNQPVNNVFDNMERWITYVIRKGINNKTAQNLVIAAEEYLEDEVTKIPSGISSPRENTIAIWQNGGLVKYKFNDPLFVKAFTGMETVALPMFPKMAKIANILRQNIVLYPLFSVSQVFQDAYSAMVTSGVDNPFAIPLEVMKEIIKTSTGVSQARKQLKSVGAVGIRDYSAEVSKLDAEIAAGMKKPGFFDRYIKNPLQKFSMASDNVIRQAIYAQTMKETGDKALATERAFEVINFRRTGSNKLVSVGRQVIPFFGAYLQSLNVMMKIASGRGIAPTQRAEAHKVLRNTIMKTMILSFFYAALTADDEDYEKLDPSIRDRRFIFPGTGGMSIPIRPDLASLITKVIPEHVYHRYIRDDEDATKMWKSLGGALANAVTGPSPYPQALKTVGELAYNYDMFTGRPIVGTGPAGKEEEMQYTARTSEMAKVLGDYTGTSPMKWDHFLDGYLGYTAGLIRMATNPLMADIRGDVLPSKSVQDYITELPGTSAFIAKEFGTRAKNDYYELRNEVDRAYATYKDKQQFRGPEETEAYLSKDNKRDLIVRKGLVDDLGKYLSQLRKMERSVMEDKYMSPDEKQQKLRFIKEEEAIMFDHLEEFKGGQAKYIQKIRREAGL
jgi:Large polyvalent protein associated domain 38